MIAIIVLAETIIFCGIVAWFLKRLETIEQRQAKQIGQDEPNSLFLDAYNEVAEITGDPKIEKRPAVAKVQEKVEPTPRKETNVFPGQIWKLPGGLKVKIYSADTYTVQYWVGNSISTVPRKAFIDSATIA